MEEVLKEDDSRVVDAARLREGHTAKVPQELVTISVLQDCLTNVGMQTKYPISMFRPDWPG